MELVKILKTLWLPIALLCSGLALLFSAALLADRASLGECLALDLRGASAEGTVEQREEGRYRISFRDADGNIYARLYSQGLLLQVLSKGTGRVSVRYDAQNPRRFQPAGASVLPGMGVLLLSAAGLALIVGGRRMLRRQGRSGLRTASPAAGRSGNDSP